MGGLWHIRITIRLAVIIYLAAFCSVCGTLGTVAAEILPENSVYDSAVLFDWVLENKSSLDHVSYIESHFDEITEDDDTVVAAMILSRWAGNFGLAQRLAIKAASHPPPHHPRFIYEFAYLLERMGNCRLALTLLQVLLKGSENSTGWLQDEARALFAKCSEKSRWRSTMGFDFGYDSNLANVSARQSIKIEEGSQLDDLISEIEETAPSLNISDQFTLGRDVKSGYWSRVNWWFQRDWHEEGKRTRVKISPSVKATYPSNYEQISLDSQVLREWYWVPFTVVNRIDFSAYRRFLGPSYGRENNLDSQIFLGAAWRSRYHFQIGLLSGSGESRGNSTIAYSYDGHSIEFTEPKRRDMLPPWTLRLLSLNRRASVSTYDSHSTSLSGRIGPFFLDNGRALFVDGLYDITKVKEPRPWLASRHRKHSAKIGLRYRFSAFGLPVDAVAHYHKVNSADMFESGQNWLLFLRFYR